MAKKGGKEKGGKGKAKKSSITSADANVPKPPEEKKIEVEEPCVFNCAMDKVGYRPNSYPGLLQLPRSMAVVGSECGSYDSLCKLLHAAFRCADRVYVMVPWGNYVVFRSNTGTQTIYFVFDGCTCNLNRFRYADLTCGTAGLLYFAEMHKVINYLIMSRSRREELNSLKRCVVDDVCKEMCGKQHT